MRSSQSADDFFLTAEHWADEIRRLRDIVTGENFDEVIKWGGPCYTWKGKNVVAIGAFKTYFGLWFFQGALLEDGDGVLINAQQGKTRAMRQWRMTSSREIRSGAIRRYLREAKSLVESGREISPRRDRPIEMPDELSRAMRRTRGATAAFRGLRKAQRREYADYVASAKRDDTRARRIDRILPMILAGQGLNDKYRR